MWRLCDDYSFSPIYRTLSQEKPDHERSMTVNMGGNCTNSIKIDTSQDESNQENRDNQCNPNLFGVYTNINRQRRLIYSIYSISYVDLKGFSSSRKTVKHFRKWDEHDNRVTFPRLQDIQMFKSIVSNDYASYYSITNLRNEEFSLIKLLPIGL